MHAIWLYAGGGLIFALAGRHQSPGVNRRELMVGLGDNVVHDVSVYVGEPEVSTCITIG